MWGQATLVTLVEAVLPRYLRVLLGYTLLGLLLTWPMIARLATHVPGDGIDDPALAWNLWWVKRALVDQPQNVFQVGWQFWPIGVNLAFYTLTVLNGMLSVPLQAVGGVVPAYNLLLLSSFVLCGLGGYLLSREFLRGKKDPLAQWAAFIGGALYAFASAKLFYAALGQGNIASSQWAPFAALYIWRAARPAGRWQDAALAAVFLGLQAYAELTYASFLLIFAGIAFLWGLLQRGRRPLPLLGRFALMAALFGAALAPVLANMLPDLRAEGDFFTSGGGFADIFSADLAGYLVPTMLHPLLGGIVKGWSAAAAEAGRQFAVDKGQHIYMGYIALALAVAGAWRGRRKAAGWLWIASALIFFLLTLGPTLRIAGLDTGIPLPFRLVEQLPFFKGNRYPSRYSVMLLLSLAPLAAMGAYRALRWVVSANRRRFFATEVAEVAENPLRSLRPLRQNRVFLAAGVVLALMLFEHLSAPLPSSDLRVPSLYDRLAATPGDFALLELPMGWRNGARVAGKQDVIIMAQLWNQTAHGKRVLGGNTSRNPEFKFQYFSELPTLARLIALTNAADVPQHDALRAQLAAMPITDADRTQAREWAAFTNIRYVMVHRDRLPAETEAAAVDLLALKLVAEDGSLALYEVPASEPPAVYRVGEDAGRMALAEGWAPVAPGAQGAAGEPLPAYAQRGEVRLLLPIGDGPAQLRLTASALAPQQTVRVLADGDDLGEKALSFGKTELIFDVPARAGRPPLSDVRLRFGKTLPFDEFAMRLSRTGPAGLLVRSAGQEAGDFGHIFLDGIDVSPNRRGYNLVALDQTGALLQAVNFDTHADPTASARMAAWIKAQPAGAVIAGAARDEASMSLGQDAVDALQAIGVETDLRGHFRWGHAFIAPVGAGGAWWSAKQEVSDAIRPAQVSVGLPLSEPRVVAEVETVEVRRGE